MAASLKPRNSRDRWFVNGVAEETKVISARVPVTVFDEVSKIAKDNGSSIAGVVEAAIFDYLKGGF
jgi:hypothetical protein